MSFINVAAGQQIKATHVQQFTRWLTGAKLDTPGTIACTSSSEFALTVRSEDGTTGMALAVQYGAAATPTTVALFTKDLIRLRLNNTSHAVEVTNTGVSLTGTVTVNGGAVDTGQTRFNIADHGMVTGSTLAVATANDLAWATMLSTVATAAGGTIYIPPGTWPFTDIDENHGLGFGMPIWVIGEPGASEIKFFGTASAAFWDIGGTASSPNVRGGIRDIVISHNDAVASGPTLRLGYVQQFLIENVRWLADTASHAALIPVQIGNSTLVTTEIRLHNCDLKTRYDALLGLVPISLFLNNPAGAGNSGLYVLNCNLSGSNSVTGGSVGMYVLGAGGWDTIEVNGGLWKDHRYGILVGATATAASNVSNVTITDTKFDGCQQYGLLLQPGTNVSLSNWQLDHIWVNSTGYGLFVTESSAGSVDNLGINDSYYTNCPSGGIYVDDGVDTVRIGGNHVNGRSSITSNWGIYLGAGTGGIVWANQASVATSASGAAFFSATRDPVNGFGNEWYGVIATFGGATSASRVYSTATNAFKA